MEYPHIKESFFMISRELTQSEKFEKLSFESKGMLLMLISFAWKDNFNSGYNLSLRNKGEGPMSREDIRLLVAPEKSVGWLKDHLEELRNNNFLTRKIIFNKSYYILINIPEIISKNKKQDKEEVLFISAEELRKELLKFGMNYEFFETDLWQPNNDSLIEEQYNKLKELLQKDNVDDIIKVFRSWCKKKIYNNKETSNNKKYFNNIDEELTKW